MYGCVYPRSPSAPGSRGIGRECCLALARQGCSVAIVAKTVVEVNPNLPGTIHTVAKEVEELGQAALPVQCDMRNEEAVEECVEQVVATFGTVHILINNASALWWQDITATPMSKYDLITSINVRGTFAMTQACLPYMEENSFGRIINMSPPIKLDPGAYAGMTAYNISKYGMTSESLTGAVGSAAAQQPPAWLCCLRSRFGTDRTAIVCCSHVLWFGSSPRVCNMRTVCALGVAGEYGPDSPEDPGITANSLWPATVVESQASINFELGDTSTWRKATVLADATVAICGEGDEFTGNMLIDDEYLRWKGLGPEHFLQYRCDPQTEPLRLLADGQTEGEWLATEAAAAGGGSGGTAGRHGSIKRGDVKTLEEDISTTENPAFRKPAAKL